MRRRLTARTAFIARDCVKENMEFLVKGRMFDNYNRECGRYL